jgi:hypothetical protein
VRKAAKRTEATIQMTRPDRLRWVAASHAFLTKRLQCIQRPLGEAANSNLAELGGD